MDALAIVVFGGNIVRRLEGRVMEPVTTQGGRRCCCQLFFPSLLNEMCETGSFDKSSRPFNDLRPDHQIVQNVVYTVASSSLVCVSFYEFTYDL